MITTHLFNGEEMSLKSDPTLLNLKKDIRHSQAMPLNFQTSCLNIV